MSSDAPSTDTGHGSGSGVRSGCPASFPVALAPMNAALTRVAGEEYPTDFRMAFARSFTNSRSKRSASVAFTTTCCIAALMVSIVTGSLRVSSGATIVSTVTALAGFFALFFFFGSTPATGAGVLVFMSHFSPLRSYAV